MNIINLFTSLFVSIGVSASIYDKPKKLNNVDDLIVGEIYSFDEQRFFEDTFHGDFLKLIDKFVGGGFYFTSDYFIGDESWHEDDPYYLGYGLTTDYEPSLDYGFDNFYNDYLSQGLYALEYTDDVVLYLNSDNAAYFYCNVFRYSGNFYSNTFQLNEILPYLTKVTNDTYYLNYNLNYDNYIVNHSDLADFNSNFGNNMPYFRWNLPFSIDVDNHSYTYIQYLRNGNIALGYDGILTYDALYTWYTHSLGFSWVARKGSFKFNLMSYQYDLLDVVHKNVFDTIFIKSDNYRNINGYYAINPHVYDNVSNNTAYDYPLNYRSCFDGQYYSYIKLVRCTYSYAKTNYLYVGEDNQVNWAYRLCAYNNVQDTDYITLIYINNNLVWCFNWFVDSYQYVYLTSNIQPNTYITVVNDSVPLLLRSDRYYQGGISQLDNSDYIASSNIEDANSLFGTLLNSIFTAPSTIIKDSLNFEIFGVNVAGLVFFVLTICLVIFVIKVFRS